MGICSVPRGSGCGESRWDKLCLCPQSQQQPPPSQHLAKPKGDATLKMRASVRMTRYLESWGAARPFAHLNHRESVSSTETLVPSGRRPKVCLAGCDVFLSVKWASEYTAGPADQSM